MMSGTPADQVNCVTYINLKDLCCMSSCLNLVMVLLENNTLESALVDLSEGELQFTVLDEDIHKEMALLQQDEQEQSKEADGEQTKMIDLHKFLAFSQEFTFHPPPPLPECF